MKNFCWKKLNNNMNMNLKWNNKKKVNNRHLRINKRKKYFVKKMK
jgi:hypothetical protein